MGPGRTMHATPGIRLCHHGKGEGILQVYLQSQMSPWGVPQKGGYVGWAQAHQGHPLKESLEVES